MKLVTFEAPESRMPRCGLLFEDKLVVDLEGACATWLADSVPRYRAYQLAAALTPTDTSAFLAGNVISESAARSVAAFVAGRRELGIPVAGPRGENIVFELAALTLLAVVPRPGKFISTAKNFRHRSNGMDSDEMEQTAALPEQPVGIIKMSSAILGPAGIVPYPSETQKLDYGVEIAVIIGKRAHNIEPENAAEYIFGYTVFNDIIARDIYAREKSVGIPLLSKNYYGFAPLGPTITTRDEIASLRDMRLTCRVNGALRQDSTLAGMIFSVEEIVSHWSQIGLEPGDIVTTGSPFSAERENPGEVPIWLRPGDIIEAEVSGLGLLRTIVGPAG